MRTIWAGFQTLGFLGLIAKDSSHSSPIWTVVAVVGFAVAIPAMCVYGWLWWRDPLRD